MKDTNLTDLEKKVIEALKNADEFDGLPTDCIGNLADNTGLSTKILRGVLSSLQQKGLIRQGEYPNGMTSFGLLD